MMNNLKCSVDNCANYRDHRCCLSGIDISGPHSDNRQETCCSSFRCIGDNCNGVGATNSAEPYQDDCPCAETEIHCTAKKCVHNHGGDCDANCVCVGIGNFDTNSKKETQCETFATHL